MYGKALAKRAGASPAHETLTFDAKSGELALRGRVSRLEPKAGNVLTQLTKSQGELVSRQQLLDDIWGEYSGSDEALTQAVAQIRRAFQELGEPNRIETLAKRGYRITAEIRPGERAQWEAPGTRVRSSTAAWLCLLAAALLLLTYARPHALRHFVRHNLGLWAPDARPH